MRTPTPAEKVAMELIRFHGEELEMDNAQYGHLNPLDSRIPTIRERVLPRLDNNEGLYRRALRLVDEEDGRY